MVPPCVGVAVPPLRSALALGTPLRMVVRRVSMTPICSSASCVRSSIQGGLPLYAANRMSFLRVFVMFRHRFVMASLFLVLFMLIGVFLRLVFGVPCHNIMCCCLQVFPRCTSLGSPCGVFEVFLPMLILLVAVVFSFIRVVRVHSIVVFFRSFARVPGFAFVAVRHVAMVYRSGMPQEPALLSRRVRLTAMVVRVRLVVVHRVCVLYSL